MYNDLLIVSCSKAKNVEEFKETWLYKSYLKNFTLIQQENNILNFQWNNWQMFATVILNNTEGLGKNYNKILDTVEDNNVLFIHDDVRIEDGDLKSKLFRAFNHYDIVGLAGAGDYTAKDLGLWHICSSRDKHSGAVGHPVGESQMFVTCFGVTPREVVVLDGLFLALNNKAIKMGVRFNENYDFHFYDISFSLDAHKKGFKLGTWPIWCVHKSPGLMDINDPTFVKNRDKFLAEYKDVSVAV